MQKPCDHSSACVRVLSGPQSRHRFRRRPQDDQRVPAFNIRLLLPVVPMISDSTFLSSVRRCAVTGCHGTPRVRKGFDWLCFPHRHCDPMSLPPLPDIVPPKRRWPQKRKWRTLGRCPTQKGLPLLLRRHPTADQCRIADCPFKPRHRGLCYSHRKKIGRLGLLDAFGIPNTNSFPLVLREVLAPDLCRIAGCPYPPQSRGLCFSHRRKLGKDGIARFGAPKKSTHPVKAVVLAGEEEHG